MEHSKSVRYFQDEIVALVEHYGGLGYYYKDNGLRGFSHHGKVVWYMPVGDKLVQLERGTPEEEFDRLQHARFCRTRSF